MGGRKDKQDGTVGHRAGRNTTAQERAFADEPSIGSRDEMEPDATGVAVELDEGEGFYQPTAMFDRGEFLGELADVVDGVPDTRAAVAAEPAPPAGCRLIVVSGPDLGMEWAFKKAEIHIGRGADNDLDFSDIGVSRHHARISLDGMHYYLSDLGSNNGTLLNGEKVDNDVLSSGDELLVGARTLRFVELNEAPATAAAHPIAEPDPEPVVGRPSEIVASVAKDDEPEVGEASVQVPGVMEPAMSIGSVPAAVPAPKGASFLKPLMMGVLMLLGVGAFSYMGFRVYQAVTGESEADRRMRASTEFLQGIELVKQKRCGDALVLFEDVLRLRPEYTRAKEYLAHCSKQIEHWRTLEAARKLAESSRYEEAVFRLDSIDPKSDYRDETLEARREWSKVIARTRVQEARVLMSSGDLEGAAQMLQEVLRTSPGFRGATQLLEEIEAIRHPVEVPKVVPKKRPPTTPEDMDRAVTLYRADRISAAIDAAEAAGGPNAAVYMERMRAVSGLLAEIEVAHRKKAAGEVLRIAPKLLEVDRKIGLGKGAIRDRVRGYFADALYLRGLEAQQDGDYPQAYKMLDEALRIDPGHKLSRTRLTELSRKARELYYEGYVLKDKDPDETKKIFRKILQMTPPDNQFHKWADKWLKGNGG